MKNNLPKILYTTPILHHPPISGPYLRVENSIKALSKVSNLYLYSRPSIYDIGGKQAFDFYKQYSENIYFSPLSSFYLPNVFNAFTEKTFHKKFLPVRTESEEVYRNILRVADDIGADLIWLGFGNLSYPLLKFIKQNSRYKIVLDTDNVWSRFILRSSPFIEKEKEKAKIVKVGKAKEAEEIWGAKLADVTTGVSEVDASYYRKFARKKDQVKIFSNVVDLECYEARKSLTNANPSILLSGTFWPRSPMEDAARWFIKKIWPVLKKRIPNLNLYIIGTGSKETLKDIHNDRIIIEGKVESVLPYLFSASVAIVPLRFESGTRFKILEAGACGTPVVSTSLGAEGLDVQNGRDILIADTINDFTNSIIKLIKNKKAAIKLAQNLRWRVKNFYSIKNLESEAKTILDYFNHRS